MIIPSNKSLVSIQMLGKFYQELPQLEAAVFRSMPAFSKRRKLIFTECRLYVGAIPDTLGNLHDKQMM